MSCTSGCFTEHISAVCTRKWKATVLSLKSGKHEDALHQVFTHETPISLSLQLHLTAMKGLFHTLSHLHRKYQVLHLTGECTSCLQSLYCWQLCQTWQWWRWQGRRKRWLLMTAKVLVLLDLCLIYIIIHLRANNRLTTQWCIICTQMKSEKSRVYEKNVSLE